MNSNLTADKPKQEKTSSAPRDPDTIATIEKARRSVRQVEKALDDLEDRFQTTLPELPAETRKYNEACNALDKAASCLDTLGDMITE